MHKNRVKKWVGMIFLLAICVLFNTGIDVFAANSCTDSETSNQFGITHKFKYVNGHVESIEITSKVKYLKIKLYSSAQKKGKKVKEIASNNSIPTISVNKQQKGNKTIYTISKNKFSQYTDSRGVTDFSVLVYAEEDSSRKCAKKGYWYEISLEGDDEAVSSGNVDSIYYGSQICTRANNLLSKVKNAPQQITDFISSAMTPCFQEKVPYNISLEALNKIFVKLEDFVDLYNKSYSTVNLTTDLPRLDSSWVEVKNTNMNSTKKYEQYGSSKQSMLTCDTKHEVTTKRFFHVEEKIEKATVKKQGQSKEVNACTTKCREQVEVTYGPPKAVVAGQCFTYEVEIKSKVVCNASLNLDSLPKYSDYAPCLLKAHCNNLNGYEEQAGPNEEFDQCVQECDGGEYSQSCINSCYNRVYNKKQKSNLVEKTGKELNNNLDNVKAYAEDTLTLGNLVTNGKTAKKVVKDSNLYGCPNVSNNPSVDEIKNVYRYANAHVTGTYSISGNDIVYTPNGGCEWNNYGYAYFRDLALTARTVCNDRGLNWDRNTPFQCKQTNEPCSASNGCYVGIKRSGAKYITTNGFKRSQSCSETCKWINTGVDVGGTSCSYLNPADAENQYVSDISSYTSAVSKCLNKSATCVEEGETATFVMSANTDIQTGADKQECTSNYGSQKNCLSWQKTPIKNKLEDNRKAIDEKTETSNNIIKFMGGSCADESSDWIYHTILTFPGAWINNKNGEISYNKQDEKYYKHYSGNYCTPLNAKNVNANWWLWDQYVKSNQTTKSFEEWANTSSNKKLVYNIFSRIKKFGLYNWSMDVGCFYAINNQTLPPDTPPACTDGNCPSPAQNPAPPAICTNKSCIPECSGSSCETDIDTSFDNFTSKSISTTTMFPSSKKTSTSSTDHVGAKKLSYTDKLSNIQKMANKSPTRAKGYNWSVEATNLSVKGYPVTPSSLVKKIESSGSATYDDSEIDYDITLTPNNIRAIKNISGKKAEYTYFGDGKYTEVKNGYKEKYISAGYTEASIPSYTYYKSDFIRKSQYVSTVSKAPAAGGLPCNNLKDSNSCDITLGGFVTSDDKLQAFISR